MKTLIFAFFIGCMATSVKAFSEKSDAAIEAINFSLSSEANAYINTNSHIYGTLLNAAARSPIISHLGAELYASTLFSDGNIIGKSCDITQYSAGGEIILRDVHTGQITVSHREILDSTCSSISGKKEFHNTQDSAYADYFIGNLTLGAIAARNEVRDKINYGGKAFYYLTENMEIGFTAYDYNAIGVSAEIQPKDKSFSFFTQASHQFRSENSIPGNNFLIGITYHIRSPVSLKSRDRMY